jgi:hypothetical protein
MNHLRSNLRLLGTAAGLLRWLLPTTVLLVLALTWWIPQRRTLLPTIAVILTACTWLLLGSRLLGLLDQAQAARLPGLARAFGELLALALACTVLLPSLLCALGGADPGQLLLMLLLAASGGVLISALPVWTAALLGLLPGALSAVLPKGSGALLLAYPRSSMLLASVLASILTAWCYLYMRARDHAQHAPWTRPFWMSMQLRSQGDGTVKQAVESQNGRMAWLQGIARPVLRGELHRNPQQAMGYALGPGFGSGSAAATALTSLAMPLLVLLCWIPMIVLDTHSSYLALLLANVMTSFNSIKFLQRLWLWRKQTNLGLLEAALLPGLGAPGEVNQVFCGLVLRSALRAMLPWLGITWLLGALLHAPHAYYPLTVLINASAMMSACAIILLCMRWPRGGLAMGVVNIGLLLTTCLSIATVTDPSASQGWLIPTWSLLLIAATGLYQLAARLLGRRPHPWLLN